MKYLHVALISLLIFSSHLSFAFFNPSKMMNSGMKMMSSGPKMMASMAPMGMMSEMALQMCRTPMAGPMSSMFGMMPMPGKQGLIRSEMKRMLSSSNSQQLLKAIKCATRNPQVAQLMLDQLRQEQGPYKASGIRPSLYEALGIRPHLLYSLSDNMAGNNLVAINAMELAWANRQISLFLFEHINSYVFKKLVLAVNRDHNQHFGIPVVASYFLKLLSRHAALLSQMGPQFMDMILSLPPEDLMPFMGRLQMAGEVLGMSPELAQFFEQVKSQLKM